MFTLLSLIIIASLITLIEYIIYSIKYFRYCRYNMFTDMVFPITKVVCLITGITLLIIYIIMPLTINHRLNEYKATKISIENSRANDLTELERMNILNKIININTNIEDHRVFHNSKWVGLWYSKQIADLEYIK